MLSIVVLAVVARPGLKAQQPSAVVSANAVGGVFGGADEDRVEAKSVVYLPPPKATPAELKTRLKLQEKIPINFPKNTTLEDVKKYLETATVDKTDFPDGIPIYFDPMGLMCVDKTMADTVTLQLKNIPLETTLRLMLRQLSLGYWINKDGLLIVTDDSSGDPILTQADIDHEILSNLNSLRLEVKELKDELRALRGAEKHTKEPTVGLPRPQTGGAAM